MHPVYHLTFRRQTFWRVRIAFSDRQASDPRLDFAGRKTAAAKISSIEAIDSSGDKNALEMSISDMLNVGEIDLFLQDGKTQMMVKGSASDTLNLYSTHIDNVANGEWSRPVESQVDGVTYRVSEHSATRAELIVRGVQLIVH